MPFSEPGKTKFQVDLRRHLRNQDISDNLVHLICEIAEASKYVINAVRTGDLGVAGTSNLYGEEQLALDVLSDRIIRKRLIHSGVVCNIASEEMDEIFQAQADADGLYSVAYDPLDGSSLVDVNLAVGTIVSIYEGCNLLQKGRNQVAAMYILYGPRVSLVYSVGKGVHEFTMNHLMEYTLSRENVTMKPDGDIYSPGGLRKKYLPETEKFVQHLESKGSKLRYSGGFVPDINQVLMKGKGIFMYPALNGSPNGKLRVLFELNPMAYLIENAGGAATDGKTPILDIEPQSLDQRAPIFIGCSNDVATAMEFMGG
ncbi:class 1 fructose-bisphosphatase [Geobacter sulfurreducens]|jgi:fructose-1,6-bisphosphatase I|uniref:Fructose-1,6-bisphosphatase class 1 n=1 Tax=Geobacter sulfurreducens (strain ATCC 51573 / DSM 12127 / PCA) TaxID=243231 RepID=F16PA_GEOSL|nr:class 1 fructose-bisphosphatase [Geobacter sulfurreducens]Q74CM2.1 RecName: Full=Fructose-1,6-bisphosphatase class 1; Short=FBPase class 1; AltName: Full=D-fructose-1,6-bisphosphate 1-phosphohydrolase class 1 [Geobacter sulfurreducens PCA]BET58044.1 class 1 fructose-bisphosphatase [Geobacter sp. 60473]AAR35025.1 fructose-1,6-bisphosphatase [Geobacter sulfurreducens PCA]ADI84485.1 fructose-1,6-bisphosphatase [Geobacter sulfurreducens KN400]AJY71469.1 fructose 1,6-bisphosphatase [Geobacter su